MAIYVAAGVASVRDARSRSCKTSAHTITSLYGAVAFSLFYWFATPILRPAEPLTWAVARRGDRARRHLVRAHRAQGEAVPRARVGRPRPPPRRRSAAPAPARVAPRARCGNAPEITFVPDNKRVAPKPGRRCWRPPRPPGWRSRPAAGWASAEPIRSRSSPGMRLHLARRRRRARDAQPPRLRREHADGVLREESPARSRSRCTPDKAEAPVAEPASAASSTTRSSRRSS